jgi:hypothetical protein
MKKLALVTTLIIAATGAYAETAKSAPEAAAPAATTTAPTQVKKEHKANHAVKAKHTEVKAEEVKPAAEKMK